MARIPGQDIVWCGNGIVAGTQPDPNDLEPDTETGPATAPQPRKHGLPGDLDENGRPIPAVCDPFVFGPDGKRPTNGQR